MAGKEGLVLSGLEAAAKNIDQFLLCFPSSTIDTVRNKILEENAMNQKEWDPSLGDIVNLAPTI